MEAEVDDPLWPPPYVVQDDMMVATAGYEASTSWPRPEYVADNITYERLLILLEHQIIDAMPNFTNGLPPCELCLHQSKEPAYLNYNLVVIGIILPIVGFFGLIGNALSAFTYSRPEMRSSTNNYLCALACSDSAVILTGIFIFTVDSIRRYSLPINTLFAAMSPTLYTMGLIAQTCSVYFTVVAGIDCFIQVCLPTKIKNLSTGRGITRNTILAVVLFSILYNIPHCFEAVVISCYHNQYDGPSYEVCPAPLRYNEMYATVYYKYMYSIFLAVGPLILLIMLNVCIITVSVFSSGPSNNGDTISLILVVLLFIFCNSAALLLNIFEEELDERLKHNMNYIIDLSNLLVVFNSSFNFVIYMKFSDAFRNTLKLHLNGRRAVKTSRTSRV
ncbi:unnamed protein product, partial [Mesorhabditis spiculigera]